MVLVAPGVELAAEFPRALHDAAQPAISPAHKALELARLDVVPAQVQPVSA